MNRQNRRKVEREVQKKAETIKKLTPSQLKLIDILATEKASNMIDMYTNNLSMLWDRTMSAALVEDGYSIKEIEYLQNRIGELIEEDEQKTKILEKEGINMEKISREVQQVTEELINKGLSKSEIIKELQFKFPKLSKSMVTNAYQKVREDLDKQKDNEETDSTVNKIMDIIDSSEYKKDDKNIEISKEMQCKKVESKETTSIKSKLNIVDVEMKLEGENGLYTACAGGISLENDGASLHFKDIDQFKIWVSEFEEVFNVYKNKIAV